MKDIISRGDKWKYRDKRIRNTSDIEQSCGIRDKETSSQRRDGQDWRIALQCPRRSWPDSHRLNPLSYARMQTEPELYRGEPDVVAADIC